MSKALDFTELEQDLLAEMFNLGVGSAAASLSKMVHQEVLLSVPRVGFIPEGEVNLLLHTSGRICGVSQQLDGPFHANSMLIFPEEHSLEVVALMLGDSYSREMLIELQPEAFAEIGNIVLNACIGSIAKMLNTHFDVKLPQFKLGNVDELLAHRPHQSSGYILLVTIDMRLKSNDVTGYLAFILGTDSMELLQQQLKKILTHL
ncbi:chemotaxis protein CheC [Ectothiorhodospiraceae bacterium BW-2]|nr:chemotaxis protein CheC [Ectothiorhodospiraceae bacterium BW-2]